MGASVNIVEVARHSFMQRADSVDYAVILSGEVYMLLNNDEMYFTAGDMVVQRGTNHAWSNHGTEPCVIAFILIDRVISCDAEDEAKKGIPHR